jgi:hypothetical protein
MPKLEAGGDRMIIGLIATSLGVVGSIGFFSGNFTLVAIGGIAAFIEILIGIYTGELRSITTAVIAAIVGVLYASTASIPIALGVVIGLCFESAISGILLFAVLGWVMVKGRSEE